tara:strand:+ start:2305 stop:3138 length:834 start_codon:yes stop_codon:yes gene_type:complete
MKTILVTGCSHSAGVECSDKLIFDNYEQYLSDCKVLTEHEIHKIKLKHQLKFLLEKFNNKKLKTYMATDISKAGDIASKFFKMLDKTYSWPTELQQNLTDYQIINLAEGGNSFKLNVKNTLDFIKKHNSELIVIHQVPSSARTYVKHNRKIHSVVNLLDLEFKQELYSYDSTMSKTIDILKQKYKNLVKRDVKHNYFKKALSQYLKCLVKNSNESVQHFFILEDNDQNDIFPKQNIIMENFKAFRKDYQIGKSHVIDPKFQKDIINLIISKILPKKV